MTRLVEFRPGVFAREGETVQADGRWWTFCEGEWHPFGDWTPPELLSFPVASTDKPLSLAWGWETNQ